MKALKTLYRFCSSWTGTIIIVLLLIFFIAQAFVIPSRSMVGTLYEGDFLFVKNLAMAFLFLEFHGLRFLFCRI